jgi:sugar lactone lactonase YvrE
MRVAAMLFLFAAAVEPPKYLIVSAPHYSKVEYFRIPGDKTPIPLIDAGLKHPQGIAVDGKLARLFVADPDQRKVFYYQLAFTNGLLMVEGDPKVAVQNVEARWVTVDGVGNVFVTDELTNVVMKVSGEDLARGISTPHVIYDGALHAEVNRPGGIATDNFHVFWSNKAVGTQVGSVIRGSEQGAQPGTALSAIAKNANKVYGVCLSQNNVFYTNEFTFIYGVKKSGGAIATVSDKLLGPRGCTWDGDGTIYLADKTAKAIYEFPSNMHVLAPAQLVKVVDYDDAFGVAVIQASAHGAFFALLLGAVFA